jgi:hypothetical protein
MALASAMRAVATVTGAESAGVISVAAGAALAVEAGDEDGRLDGGGGGEVGGDDDARREGPAGRDALDGAHDPAAVLGLRALKEHGGGARDEAGRDDALVFW